jgi:hypothetical protein
MLCIKQGFFGGVLGKEIYIVNLVVKKYLFKNLSKIHFVTSKVGKFCVQCNFHYSLYINFFGLCTLTNVVSCA